MDLLCMDFAWRGSVWVMTRILSRTQTHCLDMIYTLLLFPSVTFWFSSPCRWMFVRHRISSIWSWSLTTKRWWHEGMKRWWNVCWATVVKLVNISSFRILATRNVINHFSCSPPSSLRSACASSLDLIVKFEQEFPWRQHRPFLRG